MRPIRLVACGALAIMLSGAPDARAASPVVFYTDLESGPSSGGENGKGAYLSIYGNNFGAQQSGSMVRIGGGAVAGYLAWSNQRIAVQLGPSVKTGAVVVTAGGAESNANVKFTVRRGNLYFVSPRGSDSANGSFAHPFATIPKCKNALAAGDICYAMDGVQQSAEETYNAALAIMTSGTPENPKAIVAYPGATVKIGGGGTEYGIRTPGISGAPFEYWTIAGIHLGGAIALEIMGRGWRIVGNDLQCPTGDGSAACAEGSVAIHAKFLGNEVHSAGCGEDRAFGAQPCRWMKAGTTISSSGTTLTLSGFTSDFTVPDRILVNGQIRRVTKCSRYSCTMDAPFSPDLPAGTAWQFRNFAPDKKYHSVYFTTDSTDVEVAWNHIHDNLSCRAIQFHSSPLGVGRISAASNGTPIILTLTDSPLITGERAFVSGVNGNSAANGAFWVKVNNRATAELYKNKELTQPAVGNGVGTGGTVTDGLNQFDLWVHDNLIHNQTCDGINFATVDPSLGPVRAWNNVIYNVGTGASDGTGGSRFDPPGGAASYAAIYSPGGTNRGPAGSGTIQIYNNTLVDNGARRDSDSGAFSVGGAVFLNIVNTIVVQTAGEAYVTAESVKSLIQGSNNLWFGSGAPPLALTRNLNVDPSFLNPGAHDFRLKPSSSAAGAGTPISGLTTDIDGSARPSPPAIGGYDRSKTP